MTKKVAISLPDRTLRKARTAVRGGRAPNLSNYIGTLIEDASAAETFGEMLADFVARSGASARELQAARAESRAAFARAGLSRDPAQPEVRRVPTARKAG
jgi:hypothetical protein